MLTLAAAFVAFAAAVVVVPADKTSFAYLTYFFDRSSPVHPSSPERCSSQWWHPSRKLWQYLTIAYPLSTCCRRSFFLFPPTSVPRCGWPHRCRRPLLQSPQRTRHFCYSTHPPSMDLSSSSFHALTSAALFASSSTARALAASASSLNLTALSSAYLATICCPRGSCVRTQT